MDALAPSSTTAAAAPAQEREPFRGIDYYRYADRDIFFGRDDEAEELKSLVKRFRGVLLYGVSGCGKSSLINARLVAGFDQKETSVQRMRVQPVPGEEIVLMRDAAPDGGFLPSLLAQKDQAREAFSAEELLCRCLGATAAGEKAKRLVLVFDQFEELITLFDLQPKTRALREQGLGLQAGIIDVLYNLLRVETTLPVKVVCAFREDYLARMTPLISRCPELIDQALHLTPLASEHRLVSDVISGPFKSATFSRPALPATLVEKLARAFAEASNGGPVNMTVLQIVSLALYHSASPERTFDVKGIKGVMEEYLESGLAKESPAVRRAATNALAALVTSANTRNVVSRSDLLAELETEEKTPPAIAEEAIDCLVKRLRIVREELRNETQLYEIVSEFLVPWIQRQKEARRSEENRVRFWKSIGVAAAVAAVLVTFGGYQWYQHGEKTRMADDLKTANTTLKSNEALIKAQYALLDRANEIAGENARIFNERISRIQQEKALLTVDLGNARNELAEAKKTFDGAKNSLQQLVQAPRNTSASQLKFQEDVGNVAASLENVTIKPSPIAAPPPGKIPLIALLAGHTSSIRQVVTSEDGSHIATIGTDKTVRFWSPDGQLIGKADMPSAFAAAMTSCGSWLFVGGSHELRVFDLQATEKLRQEELSANKPASNALVLREKIDNAAADQITCVAVSSGNRQVLVCFSAANGKASAAVAPLAPMPPDGSLPKETKLVGEWKPLTLEAAGALTWGAYDSSGSRIITSSDDEKFRVYHSGFADGNSNGPNFTAPDPVDDAVVGNPVDCKAPVRRMIFAPDNPEMAAGGAGTKVILWKHGQIVRFLDRNTGGDEHVGGVWAVAFDREGHHFASIGTDGRCIIWDSTTEKAIARVRTGIHGRLLAVAWEGGDSAKGAWSRLALGGEDGRLEIWDMGTPASPKLLFDTPAHNGPLWGLQFYAAGEGLITWSCGVFKNKNDRANLPDAKGEAAEWSAKLNGRSDNLAALWDVDACIADGPSKNKLQKAE